MRQIMLKRDFSALKPAIKTWQSFEVIQSYLKLAKMHSKLLQGFSRERRDQFLNCWAQDTLKILGVTYSIKGVLPDNAPAIYVGNHISYLDIPLLLACRPVVFVAKKEINRWPYIGHAGRFIGVVYVNRTSFASRQITARQIANKVLWHDEKVAIFPSGTTSLDEHSVAWRAGAFRIAEQHGILVQPFRIHYEPLRAAAYIGKDMLIPHLFQLINQGNIKAVIEFGPKQKISDHRQDMKRIKQWCCSTGDYVNVT